MKSSKLSTVDIWIVSDARGQRVQLFDAFSSKTAIAAKLNVPVQDVRRLIRESLEITPLRRLAIIALPATLALLAADSTFENYAHRRPIMTVFFGTATVLLLVSFLVSARMKTGFSPNKFQQAMLRRGRCPRCAYSIVDCAKDPADGCVGCPECGAAWKLPTTPPTAT